MSLLIQKYYQTLDNLKQYGGSNNETSIRFAFQNLLNYYCYQYQLLLVPELGIKSKSGDTIYPDGTVKDALRISRGFWESKDIYDNLDDEISKKLEKGYPIDNIIFENAQHAVLIQNQQEVMRIELANAEQLDRLLQQFLDYTASNVKDFYQAVFQFSQDLPDILNKLNAVLDQQFKTNSEFKTELDTLRKICHQAIHVNIDYNYIYDMLLQHILTESLFLAVFNETEFHQENTIANQLNKLAKTFFKGDLKRNIQSQTQHYYTVIQQEALMITNHHEKQQFLKILYENFYKIYNPKDADKLGVVYTPNEIVRFMIESTDVLLKQHFNKTLDHQGVEILDPATGTGTFITELIEYLPKSKLEHKYKNEIHANEVAILPYYIASLNIEYTYKQRMGTYKSFDHLCFADTLQIQTKSTYYGSTDDMLAGLTEENTERIKNQNDRKISVIIGNPPYNANQQNENDNNKNLEYPEIDKDIKETYIKNSTAQKTKLYDMYIRFIRWASNRIGEEGLISFVINRNFIDSRQADGLRQSLSEEFDFIYMIDTLSDVRKNPKLSGTKHNVFGIQTGVAILFLVKLKTKK